MVSSDRGFCPVERPLGMGESQSAGWSAAAARRWSMRSIGPETERSGSLHRVPYGRCGLQRGTFARDGGRRHDLDRP